MSARELATGSDEITLDAHSASRLSPVLPTALSCVALLLLGQPSRAQLFQIASPIFSSLVTDDGNYTVIGAAIDGRISRSSLTGSRLYFSFTVMGGEQTLDYLKRKGRLEVDVVLLGGDEPETVSVGITQQGWARSGEAWTSQYGQLGYFTFRTYMNTRQTRHDRVELQVRDVQRNVIKPIAHGSLTYRAEVSITP